MSKNIGQKQFAPGDDSQFKTLLDGCKKRNFCFYDYWYSKTEINPESHITDAGIEGNFETDKHYYFSGTLRGALEPTTKIEIYLLIGSPSRSSEPNAFTYQYLDTVVIAGKGEELNLKFGFSPLKNACGLLFYVPNKSISIDSDVLIGDFKIYKIADELEKLVTPHKTDSLSKLGVNSPSGSCILMINGEMIKVPNSGIYEVKNGLITIKNFALLEMPTNGTVYVDYIY